ncbi:non-ribosomal peptide synthetase [Fusarium heterosporum]|uniref:Non-ribosomal peptide synthetase n=1 Tax=Fusarium heterosporum TaxID=42747 RepID=A0A8H5STE5_FUSHE|nr:non-ribosomal peptide synthetase [Fusarium heterosporum]
MSNPACGCAEVSGQSMPDLEPSFLPAFDLDEENTSKHLRFHSRLRNVDQQDLSQTCSVLCAAWAVLLRCFIGLDNVCFGFESEHNTATSGCARDVTPAVQLHMPADLDVRSILTGGSSALVFLPDNKAETLFNTSLSIRSLPSEKDIKDSTNGSVHPDSRPWCKVRMLVDPSSFETVLTWDPYFMTYEQAESINNTFQKIFGEMIDHPEVLISSLHCLSEHDERRILAWNGNPQSHVERCIHQAISEKAEMRPSAEAICAWDGSLSYAQLSSLSDILACRLQASGVEPEVFVPVCFDKSKWTVVAMLAVLKAGGIFVPLDPSQPILRLESLIRRVNARTILCSPQHQSMLENIVSELIPVEEELFERLPEHSGAFDCGSWNNGAYMIFTSGTTGEPKGALIQHGALMSSALAHGPAMMMDTSTRSLQFAASTFDVSITEILTCLILGGCVCIPSEEARLNAIEEAITQLRANWALLTPTFVKFINPENVPTLKTLVTGGEAMTEAIIRSWSHINLINCYGPAETSVVSHVHRGMKKGKNPLNIGRQVGIHCWIVDRYDHNRLMPVGAVGELIIEGQTLAREYYQEPGRTREAFIVDPEWSVHQLQRPGPRRMYKTGDLVKYNHDGTFYILGRLDAQIKFHGQRIELGEIEHHLNKSADIKHGMVVLPKKGFCKGRLLTIVQLSGASGEDLIKNGQPYKLIDSQLQDIVEAKVTEAKRSLTDRLPSYMIPSMWIAIEFIPRLQSGKLDRKQTASWVEDMSEALYRQLNPATGADSVGDFKSGNNTEMELHRIWTHVLNLKPEQLSLQQSFLSVGGDSISAMQVMSECRKRHFGLTVANIIGCKSISALALHVKEVQRPSFREETVGKPFGLSPIQRLYFSRPNHDRGHYNQSFLLRTSQKISELDMRRAIEVVIRRHSMLRARFNQLPGGPWQQRVTNEVDSSYRLRTLNLTSNDTIDHSLAESQTCLDAISGPLVAADLIEWEGHEQLLFLVAHHLVIDLVSWRIVLQELEEVLLQRDVVLDQHQPLPFQVWCDMQLHHAKTQTIQQVLPIQDIPHGDASYWGMEDIANVYGDMIHEGFEIGSQETSLLLSNCHQALRTETPDVLMAAMIYSFGQTFRDRPIPAVFAEGHGRESWDDSIDLSNVVGWFTTIYPVYAGSDTHSSLVETAKMVKDGRRKVPGNGRPYFASRWLTEQGEAVFSRHWPLEITFNYLGQYQQLERDGALFTPAGGIAGEVKGAVNGADIGTLTTCISLFEVSAVIIKGRLRFSFGFNRHMKHAPLISQWIDRCRESLCELVECLDSMIPEPTLSDFPLLALTYDRLNLLVNQNLPEAGVEDTSLVEDAYPCSPMQSGLLVSTTKDRAAYAAFTLHEVKNRNGLPVDVSKLVEAWKTIVEYHPLLRTIFVESVTLADSLFDQVVLKQVGSQAIVTQRDTDQETVAALSIPNLHQTDSSRLLHRLEICTSKSGKVFCRLDISHVIMDGTSISILFRDFALAYEGRLKPDKGPLYREYIKHLEHKTIQPGVDYWKSYLSGIEPCHFPVLHDGNVGEARQCKNFRVQFDELAELQILCDSLGVTIVNAIYAAWALTLRIYTTSEEVCFGYLTSARDSQVDGITDVVGPVINMVSCRVHASSSTTLRDMMNVVQKDYLESLDHRHIPLAQVQHALQLSDTALFNTALSYRKLPPAPPNPPDLMFEECCPTYDPDEYNVSVNIEAGQEGMAIDLMYWTDTLSDGQATNVASVFTQALSNVLHHHDLPLNQLDNLDSWHRKQLCQWNKQIPLAIESSIHDLFKKQETSRPEAPAIVSWDTSFTYAQLEEASNRLAYHLRLLGVGTEHLVIVCFEKSSYAIVAMLAILKAGGACVPLDPAHPDTALRLRIEDTSSSIALVSPSLLPRLSTMTDTVVAVDAQLLQNIPAMTDVSLPQVSPHNACFVIYTSGSTGRPKGVVLEHRGIATNALCSGPKLGYNEESRVLQFASYTFDNSLAEIFTTLLLGGCVCVPSDHDRLNDLAGTINRYRVTLADITPTVACFLKPVDVPTLKTLALGGEAVTAKCVELWRDFVSLRCCYGPSECSVNSTFSGEIAQPGKATNIGRSVGCVTWVVDATNHDLLVPVGCVGELLIDGPIVSRGYLNLPRKMAESFIDPPRCLQMMFDEENLDRKLYKTGDLVCYNSDGTLTYHGRKDTQVKLNGQRIEVEEIEHHVEQNLGEGQESAVELITVEGRKFLACFMCEDADASLRAKDDETKILGMRDTFRTWAKSLEVLLSSTMPAYMVPTVWFPISKMPLTSSGKLDRRSLRLLGQSVPLSLTTSYKLASKSGRAPEGVMEKQLAIMWADVLRINVATIGVEDHFFRLGGDSICAMQLVALARRSSITLTVTSVFQNATLLAMAQSAHPMSHTSVVSVQAFSLLSNIKSLETFKQQVATFARVDAENIRDIYPCTAIQEGMMALSSKEPGAYVAQFIYHLPDDIDDTRFMRACDTVAQAEAILRTRIVHTEDAGFVQVVLAEDAPKWSFVNRLSDLEVTRCQIPSHNGGRLSDYNIVKDGCNGTTFVWTIHHAIYDGWCLPLILNKIKRCYQESTSPSPLQLSGPKYSDFIAYLTKINPDQDVKFWKSHLSGISTQHFPRLPTPDYQPSASSLIIHKTDILEQSRMTPSDITLATRIRTAWALTVATYAGAHDVVFWETMTGRDAPVDDIENMVGITLTTVPTRVTMNPSQKVNDLLGSVQAQSAMVRSHQFAGIPLIKRINEDTTLACGAQNLLAINYGQRQSTDSFWREETSEMAGTNFYSYSLMLSCHVGDGILETAVHFDENVVSEPQMQRIMDNFALMLESVSSSKLMDQELVNLSLLSRRDRRTLMEMSQLRTPSIERLIHEAIQAEDLPQDKIAICAWDRNLTYLELDSQSTRLAGFLVEAGLGVGSIVPFCMEKSSLVVVAILAILKSGAAFVPLDPSSPDARIHSILEDVDATVILSTPLYTERLAAFGINVMTICQELISDMPPLVQRPSSLIPHSTAYVIFTSGTTGKPKGTIVSHSSFCTSAKAHGSRLGMTSSSRVLQFASYTFDASILEMLTTLTHHGTVCVPTDEERMNDISGAINRLRVNWALLTPSVAQLLRPSLVPGLQTLVLGGEAMSSAHIASWSSSVQLMNAYGPSETAVVATVNPSVTLASDPSNIGRAVGGTCWVVDTVNPDRLVPIGATGELVIEGPILAQGYLKNPEKTEESFVTNPGWSDQFPRSSASVSRRFYKTGDLVKLNDDGTIHFEGRKDNQVKVNGQRLELAEIEHHLATKPIVESCLSAVPSLGPLKGHLVAVVSLQSLSSTKKKLTEAEEMQLVKTPAASDLAAIREHLERHLASYMIPSIWIVVDQICLLPSGKLDRKGAISWIERMTPDTHQTILNAQKEASALGREPSDIEVKLRAAWAKALNLKVDIVPFKQSFVHLGGDSISAMQLMAICRSLNMMITVGQIIRTKSIIELASLVSTVEQSVIFEEKEGDFDLSPIQKVYFDCMGTNSIHFNQSMLLGTTRKVTYEELLSALQAIVRTHSMLRARFICSNGHWSQRITPEISGSYTLRSHVNVNQVRLSTLIEETQNSFNITAGPLFAADMFEMNDTGSQIISFVAHHLVVDVVSWNIILQDLERLLSSKTYTIDKPIPFQTWCSIQYEEAQTTTLEHVFPNVPPPGQDIAYWGMEDKANLHGDSIVETVEIAPKASVVLLGSHHDILDVDVVDILLASLLGSFPQSFPDRSSVPSILNEGHGREPSDSNIDLSRTQDAIDLVRWVRDFRRKMSGKGRPYFAHRVLVPESESQDQQWPVEVAFNFLGQTQRINSEESVFKSLGGSMLTSISSATDVGVAVPRLALIEITASFCGDSLSLSFSFNQQITRRSSISSWIQNTARYIENITEELSIVGHKSSSIDLSLLQLTFKPECQIERRLEELEIPSLGDIEAAYPCSSVQQGILFAQIRDPELYAYSIKFSVNRTIGNVDVSHLAEAWRYVVQRHSTLRTVFVDNLLQEGAMDQIVLRKHSADVYLIECSDDEVSQRLREQSLKGLAANKPPHRFTIVKTTEDGVICMLEMSHAIADGTSMPILFRDLTLAYEGNLATQSLSVYRDYIATLQENRERQGLNYWNTFLSGIESCTLPTLVDGLEGPKLLRVLDQGISHSAELERFCATSGVTISNVFQLAWALVLQAYTGHNDVCFGYLVSERDLPIENINNAVGVFISMLVCRVSLDPSIALSDVLATVQENVTTAMMHRTAALADFQHNISISTEPLFNTAYSFQRRSGNKNMSTGSISFDIIDAKDPSEYDLTVNVEVWDSSIELQLCYWADKISDRQAKNIASTLDKVLTSIITSDPQLPLCQLDMLSQHSIEQLSSWNNAEPELLNICVHQVFEHNTRRLPENTAAIDAWDSTFTYSELDSAASRLAQQLVSLGIGPETYVPLCFVKSAWTVVAMIAVLKAGGAFVPLDPTHPPERINFLVHNVDAKIILCSASLEHKFEIIDIPTLIVSQETVSSFYCLSTPSPRVPVQPDNAAYVIFTSGTTGLPKGTVIEHAAFTTAATAHSTAIGMTSTSRVLQFASHTFDASIMEILSTLLIGGCVCIPSEEERINDLAGAITRLKVNWTLLTPSVASVLKPGSVPTLEVLVTGGEAMSTDHVTKWENSTALVNAYGPSEASVIATTSTKVDLDGRVLNREPATIGRAVGCRCWVVDPHNHSRLMPIGSIGELLIEGPIVARGYLGNETKTRDAFITHPKWRKNMALAGSQNYRMFKTGDLVFHNSDGTLNYLNRKDTQIKLNGQRIELGEIEHHVKTNLPADIQSAVDLVVPQSRISTRALAVFFTSHEGNEDAATREADELLLPMSSGLIEFCGSLKSALGGTLPTYMVPTIYIPVVKMPWTSAGKLDRPRLKTIAQAIQPQQMTSYKLAGATLNQAPTTSMQRKLQKVWAKVLNIDHNQISKHDSFFRLGGDSVGAMKLVAAAKMENIVLTVMDIFKNPVLSDLSAISRLSEGAPSTNVEPFSLLNGITSPSLLLDEIAGRCHVRQSQIQDVYPCSSLQEGLVASSLQKPGAYVAHNVFCLSQDIDIDRFKLAWQNTVDQVDILRSRIVNVQSLKSYQVVLAPQPIEWEYYNSLDSANSASLSVPSHNGGPLARYAIVNSADAQSRYFVWTIHHALYDAWSMPSFLALVSRFYHEESPRGLISFSFSNFINYLADVDTQASDEFWRARFQDASSVSHFPTVASTTTNAVSFQASLKHTIPYKRDALGMDITIPTIIRAALALVIGTQTGSDDVIFGETLSGRDIALDNVQDILGPTLTTVPCRVQIDRDATISHLLETLHKQATQVIPYQHVGLQHIKRLGSAMALACDFKTLLVIQTADGETVQQPLLQPLESDVYEGSFFTYPLVIECSIEADILALTAHHDEAVLSTWQTKRLTHQLQVMVEQLIRLSQEPTRRVSELSFCGQEDVQMIRKWNSPTMEFPKAQDAIPNLFWKLMMMQPDATCIRAWNGQLTYHATAKYAAQLARALVSKGIGRESLVPCCMDKSLWTIVSMLAVLLAGGGIVPLDPAHPPARHAEIARDCNAHLVLCSPKYQDRFREIVTSVMPIDDELFVANSADERITPEDLPTVTSKDAAFVIYTSGSTGKPKGVIIEHGSFIASSRAFMQRMNLKPTSRVFHFTSYAFDIAMGETFGPLISGACVCVPSEYMRLADLPGAINTLGATWAFLTPSVANMQDPSKFETLQTLVCGGETLTSETIALWRDQVELINGYGPAECTLFAVANASASTEGDASIIGRAMASNHTWIVDPRDHNYLSPIGCEGELLISGPIVARGYLHDQRKTAELFVENPAWAHYFFKDEHQQAPLRLYKTGDLVRYLADGSLQYIGRKDHQVKLHGQRMELGEIEARLESYPHIRHALVSLPRSGILNGRLVAIVSFQDFVPEKSCLVSSGFNPIPESAMKATREHIAALQNDLSDNLPPYMIPSAWLVVEAIPLLLSGKLDRASAKTWLSTIDIDAYKAMADLIHDEDVASPGVTSVALQLKGIWALVLNLAEETVPMNRSLVSLGGDSIMAIQIITRCRDYFTGLTMKDVMGAKSITELATLIETQDRLVRSAIPESEEDDDKEFGLSPIQQLFFNNSSNKTRGDRFNQSQILSIRRFVDVSNLRHALDTLVKRHKMLRARFNKSIAGQWTQHTAKDIETSHCFRNHNVNRHTDMIPFIADSQQQICVAGPVFIVDFFQYPNGSQILSLVAHHLVVDIVSWINILQDLQALLSAPSAILSMPNPLSFRKWNEAQIEHAIFLEKHDEAMLPFPISSANLAFWGMSNVTNTYGDTQQKSWVVQDADMISLIMNDAHRTLKTQPLDIFISAVFKSFSATFNDRELPTLFNEGHGREPWDDSIDISNTVGWFTSLCPIHICKPDTNNGNSPNAAIDYLRQVKDMRRSVPSNGRPYFARRYMTESGKSHLAKDEPMEILLNYLGRTQQSRESDDDSLFSPVDLSLTENDMKAMSDVAPDTHRLALFEISISILDEGITFTFIYNKRMLYQDRIEEWVANCKQTLVDIARRVGEAPPTPTLSDFPLMPVGYDDLHEIVTKSLPTAHVRYDEVEDMYPCSPIQTGILLSQLLNPSQYLFHVVLEVSSPDSSAIDVSKLSEACCRVAERHTALRTVFIDSVRKGSSFDQVVLKPTDLDFKITTIKCREIDVMAKLNGVSLEKTNNRNGGPKLPYQVTICETFAGKVFMKLEMNHAVTDGASTSIVLGDISNAYNNRLSTTDAPSYKEYIEYISRHSAESNLRFWADYLSGAKFTGFPAINKKSIHMTDRTLGSHEIQFHRFHQLQSLGVKLGVTLSNMIMVAWALVLRKCTNSDDICFGYLASGRDARIDGVNAIVGPFINMLVFRFKFTGDILLRKLFLNAQQDYIASLPHQCFSLARVSHELGQTKHGFFNTAVSIQNSGVSKGWDINSLEYTPVEAFDPSEYAITLNANTTRGDEGIVLRYWNDLVSESHAQDLATAISEILGAFVDFNEGTLSDLSLSWSPNFMINNTHEVDGWTFQRDISTHEITAQTLTASSSLTSMDLGDVVFSSPNITTPFNCNSHPLNIKLSALWRDNLQLGNTTISSTDSFFELGGDSIIAMSMASSARELNIPLTVADVFKYPTFGSMIDYLGETSYQDDTSSSSNDKAYLSDHRKETIRDKQQYEPFSMIGQDRASSETFVRDHICPLTGVSRASILDVLPTTDFQAQAIEGSLLESRWMLNHFYLDATGSLDISLLQESVTNVVAAYDILRTVFVKHEGKYLQAILRTFQPKLAIHDVESIENFTLNLDSNHRREIPRPEQPSLRFIVARDKSSLRHRIFIRISHAQYDGLCFPAILQALKDSYDGEPLLPSPSYATYIHDTIGKTTPDHYSYWKALLRDSAPTNVVPRQSTSLHTASTRVLKKVVSTPSLAPFNITTATVVKAAWSSVLAKTLGKTDIVFGHLISGRNGGSVPGITSIVGPCLNVVPVRVHHQPSWTALDLLHHIQTQQVNNIPYEDLGFRQIIDKCTDWDDDGTNGFSTIVQHQSMPQTSTLAIGQNTYSVGALPSHGDSATFSVVTTPQDAQSTEVCLLFAQDGGVEATLAEKIFTSLCNTITLYSEDINRAVIIS